MGLFLDVNIFNIWKLIVRKFMKITKIFLLVDMKGYLEITPKLLRSLLINQQYEWQFWQLNEIRVRFQTLPSTNSNLFELLINA